MMLPSIFRARDHALATRPDAQPPGAAVPLPYVGATLAASALAWAVTRQPWAAAAACAVGASVCGWRAALAFAAVRAALDASRRERRAIEDALRRSQKLEALGRLAVGMAHDFNNHLTVISSNVELVKRRLDGGHEDLRRHADAAMQGVQRAAALTGRLASFARQSAAEPEPVDISRLLRGMSDMLRRTFGEGVALSIVDPGETWYVWADASALESALLSLVVNLRDQVPDGGAVTVSVDNARLGDAQLAADPLVLPGDYLRIALAASAAGAAGNETAWRAAADAAVNADLSMARAFVRQAGGYLLRSDRAGLRLLLPRYRPSPPVAPRPRQAGAPVTVLVVEDDAAVRQACVEALSTLGCRLLQASDAMEAFRLIADHGGIDLLLTDLGLPGGVSGKALADAARNVDQRMRVVFITGYDRAGIGPAAAVLGKPFSPAQLLDCVGRVLAEAAAAEDQQRRLTA